MIARLQNKKYGFSLVELLVVVVIIAVLALIMIPHFQDSGRRSKESSLQSDLALLRSSIANYYADTGVYPALITDLTAVAAPAAGVNSAGTSTPIVAANWHGPYMTSAIPTDPISGTAFTYSATGATSGQVASSATGDGLNGTLYSTW
jgi:general secretion pathway protein G